LEGLEKLAAQRDYDLKAIQMFRDHMKKMGTLTPDQEEMFKRLGGRVWDNFYIGVVEEGENQDPLMKWFLDNVDKDSKKYSDAQKEALHKENKEILDWLDKEFTGETKLGEVAKESSEMIIGYIDEVYAKRAEDATRTRELFDTRVAELQREVETEVEIQKNGYASNVKLKQDELNKMKIAREQALRDEQKALDTSRGIEMVIQSINLATSITSLFKDEIKSKGVYGLITGGLAVASLLVLWDQYKKQAETSTRLAKGGSGDDTGIVKGRSHAAGGERFTDQIEVERGEAWGVLSVPATQKYGKIFHEMVSSFNKGEIPVVNPAATINNRVLVDNNGSNSRLDKLIRENQILNQKLSVHESVQEIGSTRVIRKNNNTRIIKR
jgi:hypothetical protein